MTLDPVAVDHALMTTRAVRRRLDLDRPVDDQLILDCIDVAEQAPTGGNQGSRRWIVVRDPEVKEALAAVYMRTAGHWMIEVRDQLAGTGHANEKVMASAAHLAEHLAEVPAIVIPTIIGRHDDSGRPGLFDSVIQAAWSFCVALRARGLGTAWTTAGLSDERAVKDALGIPDEMTEIVMLPVAWTKGTDFRTAPRYPAREITYFDGFARTYERGPSTPVTLADGPGTVVEVDVKAPPKAVWPLITDINLPAEFSEEFQGAAWNDGQRAALGASFLGRNRRNDFEWEVPCFVDVFEERQAFGWAVSDPENPGARWRFELEGIAGATRLRHRVVLGPGPSGITGSIADAPDREPEIIAARLAEIRPNMQRVVEGIRGRAEA